jgi:hypothetical protein
MTRITLKDRPKAFTASHVRPARARAASASRGVDFEGVDGDGSWRLSIPRAAGCARSTRGATGHHRSSAARFGSAGGTASPWPRS